MPKIEIEPTTYDLQGMTFQLKETTPRVVKAMQERFNDPGDEFLEKEEGEQYLEMLKSISEPADDDASFDEVDPLDLNLKLVEAVYANFLPNWTTILGA